MKNHIIFYILLLGISISLFGCSDKDKIHYYTLTVEVSPENAGTVSETSGQYEEGTALIIDAYPSDGYIFKEWTGSVSKRDREIVVVMDSDKTVIAVFYNLQTEVQGEGYIRLEEMDSGEYLKLTAIPGWGWEFQEWKGSISGTENPVTWVNQWGLK